MTKEEYRERNKAACAANYEKNKERRRAWQRAYYQEHREELLMKQKLHRMGLLQRNEKRGRPFKGEATKEDELRELDIAVYEQRLAESKAKDKLKRLQSMAEELRLAGYTVTEEKENEHE